MSLFKKLDKNAAKKQLDISNRAGKIALIFYTFALIIWFIVELLQNGQTSVTWIILLILFIGFGIYLIAFTIMKKRRPWLTE